VKDDPGGVPGGRARFATTHWSLVLAAGGPDTAGAHDALATLCRLYWYPLYAFARRHGQPPDRAEDLVQAFFVKLLEKQSLQHARAERGKFRSFLLASFKNFVVNEYDRARAVKRGRGDPSVALDVSSGELRYALEPRDEATPEVLFEQQWARALVERVQVRLRAICTRGGKGALFEQLKDAMVGEETDRQCRDFALVLHMSEGSVRVAIHRLRRRFRDLLREEIRHTVEDPAGIDEEIDFLLSTLAAAGARRF
jgi:DNA-directed RNA polymerase specialized sigma24 family protein